MVKQLDARAPGFAAAFAAFLTTRRETLADVDREVAAILADVKARGDDAVIDYTERFDGSRLAARDLRLSPATIQAAIERAEPNAVAALERAAARIVAYHETQRPNDDWYIDREGVGLGVKWTPIDAVGLYVPGGKAAYPSSVLMNALPARVAGVTRVAMVVPTPTGEPDPLVLAAARIAGVSEIYRIGGAQAVAALAFGTATVRPVDKIIGPGNAYVAAAKRQVFGTVGIDMIAGPSEILVLADADNDPTWIAADLLSQAEHDESAQAILITNDAALARAVATAVTDELKSLPRASIARASWTTHGAIIVVASLHDAMSLIDAIAPEHLELAIAEPEAFSRNVRNAGAIFLGRHTPEAVGDYVGGPNHVLPTARSARFSSGLSVLDFVKRTSLLQCTSASLAAIGPTAVTLAKAEGLEGHARSIEKRLKPT
ncbi:MAG: histidinol dehydrogenase [Alphaproteobacteria bacterium]|nr:histidinol dehydrogenase [Alphaproteobacteria bacterium]